ncbi:MAG: glycosyltransferase family 4 protein [Nocardioides sp.]|uniref:glycosyltransferase family 4 protein n=1 Tax=Nocardioides sp. TaxID=35761 RepID=UPI0023A5F3F6|nr:glycosyltransferase family 4 protein [Nocardioides sp.]MDE0776520.1 glycosyltransferase family 4 protein [Nocardioides sp.]
MTTSPLRVLLAGLNYSPEPTGIAPYTSGLARGLAARGHEVHVLTTFPHYPQWRIAPGYRGWSMQETLQDVDVRRLRHYIPRGRNGIERALSEWTFGARVVGSRWDSPDVVIGVSPALIGSAMTVVRGIGGWRRPAVGLIIQDLYSAGLAETRTASGHLGKIMTSLESWSARRADGVSVIHDRFKQRVSSSLRVPESDIAVVRNWTHVPAVPDFDSDMVRQQLGWGGKQVVLHAGAMGDKQALGNVVEAARFSQSQGWNLHFVLMGDGNQRRTLEAQGRDIASLQFLDPLPDEDYGRAMRAADALLVNEKPGIVEMAVPSKLTSYFSTGVPVLAATEPTSTTADEITASGAGIRIQPGDPRGLAEAAKVLCGDKMRAAELGAAGPRYCSDVLSEEQAIDGYEAWIRDLMVRARVRRGEA